MESSNEPSQILEVTHNTDRITVVQYHPLAEDVIASVSADYVIRVWNTQTATVVIQLDAHPDQVISQLFCYHFKLVISKRIDAGIQCGLEPVREIYRFRVQGWQGANIRTAC